MTRAERVALARAMSSRASAEDLDGLRNLVAAVNNTYRALAVRAANGSNKRQSPGHNQPTPTDRRIDHVSRIPQ